MGSLLLSYFSPESLSWAGFFVLVFALVGEAGAALVAIISKGEMFHKELAFVLAIVAAGAYAIERVGDDAIISTLEAARDELKTLESPRTIKPEERAKIVRCLNAAPTKGPIFIRPGMMDSDAPEIGEQLEKIFDEAGGFEKKQWTEGPAFTWRTPGIFLVVVDLKHAPQHATEIQKCFWGAGRKIYGYADPKHPPDAVSIGIGLRL